MVLCFVKDSGVGNNHIETVMEDCVDFILVLQPFRETIPGAVGRSSRVIEIQKEGVFAGALLSNGLFMNSVS